MEVSVLGRILERVVLFVVVYKVGSKEEWDNLGMFISYILFCESIMFRLRMNFCRYTNIIELV